MALAQVAAGVFGNAGNLTQAAGGPANLVVSEGRTVPVEYTFLTNPDAKVEIYASCNRDTLFSAFNLLKVHDVGSAARRTVTHGGVNQVKLQPGEYFGVRVVANRALSGASGNDVPDPPAGTTGPPNRSVEFTKLTIGGVNMLASAQSGRRGSDLSAAEVTATAAFSLAPSVRMVAIVDLARVAGGSDPESVDLTNPAGYALAELTNPLRLGLGNPTIGTNSIKVPIGMSLFSPNIASDANREFDDSVFVLEAFTDNAGALFTPPDVPAVNFTPLSTTAVAFRQS